MAVCWFGGLGTMSASDSADSSQSSDTEDSSSTDTSSDSSIPAPYNFEPSESDSEAKMTYPPAWKTGLFPSSQDDLPNSMEHTTLPSMWIHTPLHFQVLISILSNPKQKIAKSRRPRSSFSSPHLHNPKPPTPYKLHS